MFTNNHNYNKLQIDQEIEKIRHLLDIKKKGNEIVESKEFYGIQNFWIISSSGLALFSFENNLFKSVDEKNLFGGFITAVVSLSEVLTKSRLSEIKIDNQSINIQSFENFYFVSIIKKNRDLSLKFLTNLATKYSQEINKHLGSYKFEVLADFKNDFIHFLENKELKNEIIILTAYDYISQYIFGILGLDEFFKKFHLLVKNLSKDFYKKFLAQITIFLEKINQTKVNLELINNINVVIDSITNFIHYLENKSNDEYNKYVKSMFLLFVQFYNKLMFDD
jgi:hypothetical protein